MKLQDDMHAIISGGASGLGAACAKALGDLGLRVSIFDLQEPLAPLTPHHCFYKVNVTQAEAVADSIRQARLAFGQERILINCAGIAPAMKTVSRGFPHDAELFQKVISVNLIGSFILASQSAAGMVTAEPLDSFGARGVIINTASVAAFDGQIGQVAYAASKGGVAAMTLPMARDLSSKGIRVMTIAPGIFETPMLAAMPKEVQDALAAQVPFPPRLGSGEDFAKLVLSILDNDMLNGEVIRLDGAIRMAAK